MPLLLEAQEGAGHLEAASATKAEILEIVGSPDGLAPRYRANIYVTVAKFAGRQGDVEEALELIGHARGIVVTEVGEQHGRVAATQSDRAFVLLEAGRYEDALPIQTEALEAYQKVARERDMTTASMHENLGRIHRGLGNFEEALAAQKLSLEIRLEFVKPRTAFTEQNLKWIAKLCDEDGYAPACAAKPSGL